jgi:hypothetical protein
MPFQKYLTLATALGLIASGVATPCRAATFSKSAAISAVEKLMPSDGPKEFVLFNLADPKSNADQLVYMLKESKEQNVALAIVGPKLEPIRALLTGALETAKADNLEGLYVLIVADAKDLNGFRELVKPRGIHVKCGVYR